MLKHVSLLIASLSLLGLCGCNLAKTAEAPKAKKEPPVVTVALPVEEEISEHEEFTGRTDAIFSVDVRARVTGYLEKVLFKDGIEVNEGDVLFQIDPRPYQAELVRQEAMVAQNEAHLKRLEADYKRANALYSRGGISREEYDKISGDRNEAEAAVGIAKAARDLAKLNVEWTTITAPISGLISRRMVDPGNLVKADDTIMTNIVSQEPMYVYFDVDERTLLRLRRLVRDGKLKSRREADVPVMIELADETGFPHAGLINFSDNKIDPSTGTLRVRGSIENPKPRVLSPGLFVRVRLPIGKPYKALMVPEVALGTDQGQKYIYVVEPDPKQKNVGKVVRRNNVKVGAYDRGLRVVENKLKKGELVLISGVQRIKDNDVVKFENAEVAKPEVPASPVATGEGSPKPAASPKKG